QAGSGRRCRRPAPGPDGQACDRVLPQRRLLRQGRRISPAAAHLLCQNSIQPKMDKTRSASCPSFVACAAGLDVALAVFRNPSIIINAYFPVPTCVGITQNGGKTMSFDPLKITALTKKIIALPDQPNMQPDELKQYFD